jgi:hypothetical protein
MQCSRQDLLQLQEVEDRKTGQHAMGRRRKQGVPRVVDHIRSHYEAKRRRATQDITCSFPYGKWLHMIGARASPDCELCKRERQQWKEAIDNIPAERDVKRKEERHRGPQLLEVSSRRHL